MKYCSRITILVGSFCLLTLISNCSRPPDSSKTQPQEAPQSNPANTTTSTETPPAVPPQPTETPQPGNITPSLPQPIIPSAPAPQLITPVTDNGPALRLLVPTGHAPSWLMDLVHAKIVGKIEVVTYATDLEFRDKLTKLDAKFDVVSINDRLISDLIKGGTLEPFPKALHDELPRPRVLYIHHYFDEENVYTYPYGCTLLGFRYTPPSLKDSKLPGSLQTKMETHPVAIPVPNTGPSTWKELGKSTNQISWPEEINVKESCQHFLVETNPQTASKTFTLTNVSIGFISQLNSPSKSNPVAGPLPSQSSTPTQSPVDNSQPPTSSAGSNPSRPIIVLPTDGSLITLYHWALIKNSPHLDAAQNFLRTACSAENAAHLATDNYFSVTSTAAFKLLPPEAGKDPLLYPADSLLDHCEFIRSKP